jgi:hypothetical protein
MAKKPVQEELVQLKNQFLSSIAEYLDDCILQRDIKRMKRFIAEVRDILKREAQKSG